MNRSLLRLPNAFRRCAIALCTVTLLGFSVPAAADDDICKELELTLPGSVFQTLEPLYDTEIGPDGIWRLERDEEEIDPLRPAEIVRVRCNRARIALRLRRFDWEGNPDEDAKRVDIYFYLNRVQRRDAEAFDTFEVMLGYVFEPLPEAEWADSE